METVAHFSVISILETSAQDVIRNTCHPLFLTTLLKGRWQYASTLNLTLIIN